MRQAAGSVAAALVLAACQIAEQPVSHDRLVRFFDDLVFGTDYGLERPGPKEIRKWTETIRVKITGQEADKYRPEVEAQLGRVAQLTGVEFEISELSLAEANYEVRFVPTKEFLVNKEYVPCAVGTDGNNGVIEKIRIVISTAEKGFIKGCITHEIMHSFGFGKHSGIIRSVLSPLHGEEDFTPWDEIVLRTLYDPRLRPGMTREEATPIADGILREVVSQPRVLQRNSD
ncbi:MAG: DUF2927 domain-containing protein [Rhodospirillales bacterium]